MEWTFTESERHKIDSAYHKMETGENNITPEEMQLVIKFTQWQTANDEESKARQAAYETEAKARIEESRKTEELARQNLKALSDAAMAFYERTCENGTQK